MALIVAVFLSLVLMMLFSAFSQRADSLSLNYYEKTCPNAESIVTNAVKSAVSKDKTVPAALLRLHFHDCFIRVSKVHIYIYFWKITFFFIYYFFVSLMCSFRAVMPPCCCTQKGATKQKKTGHPTYPCMHYMSLTVQRRNLKLGALAWFLVLISWLLLQGMLFP